MRHLHRRESGRFDFLKTDGRSSCLHSIHGSHGGRNGCLMKRQDSRWVLIQISITMRITTTLTIRECSSSSRDCIKGFLRIILFRPTATLRSSYYLQFTEKETGTQGHRDRFYVYLSLKPMILICQTYQVGKAMLVAPEINKREAGGLQASGVTERRRAGDRGPIVLGMWRGGG